MINSNHFFIIIVIIRDNQNSHSQKLFFTRVQCQSTLQCSLTRKTFSSIKALWRAEDGVLKEYAKKKTPFLGGELRKMDRAIWPGRGIHRKLAYGQRSGGLMAPGYSRGRGYRFSLFLSTSQYYFIVAPRFIYILFICRPTNSPDIVRDGFLSSMKSLCFVSKHSFLLFHTYFPCNFYQILF